MNVHNLSRNGPNRKPMTNTRPGGYFVRVFVFGGQLREPDKFPTLRHAKHHAEGIQGRHITHIVVESDDGAHVAMFTRGVWREMP
jgi:hypothetical protein